MRIESDTVGLNLGRMKSKKGFMPIVGTIVMVIGVVAIGYLALKGLGIVGNAPLSIKDINAGTQARIDQQKESGVQVAAPSTGLTSFDFVASNPLDTSGTTDWNAVTVKVKDKSGGALQTYTTDTDGTFASSSLSLTYGHKYDVYVIATKNATHSAGPFEVDTTDYGAAGNLLIDVPDMANPQFYVYDNKARGHVWCSGDLSAAGTTNTLAAARTCYSTTNSTAIALGNSDNLDWTFTMKTAAYKQWGDVKTYIAVDADSSDYESVAVSIDGVQLKEVKKDVLNSNDQGYLSAYEKLFEVPGSITSSSSDVRLKVDTKSTGTVDADMKFRLLQSVYRVAEDGKNVEAAIFNSAGVSLAETPDPMEITIDVS